MTEIRIPPGPTWCIANIPLQSNAWPGLARVFEGEGFEVHSTVRPAPAEGGVETLTLVFGQMYARVDGSLDDLQALADDQLVARVSADAKGVFQVVRARRDGFTIVADHHGLLKWFVWESGNRFIVSNDVWLICAHARPATDRLAVVDHCVFNRFVRGRTLFSDVRFSGPAEVLRHRSAGALDRSRHWRYTDTIASDGELVDFGQIAERFREIVRGYPAQLQARRISVPLTGGVDCRSIVAALLGGPTSIRTYVYGNQDSNDARFGRHAADRLAIPFTVHHLADEAPEYWGLSRAILRAGNGLASSHRAHRVHAAARESTTADAMFVGYLGGEVIRGLWPDDLIISRAVRRSWEGKEDLTTIARTTLDRAAFRYDAADVEYAAEQLAYFSRGTRQESYGRFLFEVKAHLHFAQDVELFNRFLPTIPFYLDPDYLLLLFSTPFTFLRSQAMTRNKLKRLSTPEFHSRLISQLHAPLAQIRLGKGFSPQEYLKHRWRAYMRTGFSRYIRRSRSTPTFEYSPRYRERLAGELAGLEAPLFEVHLAGLAASGPSERDVNRFSRIRDLAVLEGLARSAGLAQEMAAAL